MKTSLFFLLLAAATLRAQIAIEVLPQSSVPPPSFAVFGGDDISLRLKITAFGQAEGKIIYDLKQVGAGEILASLAHNMPVSDVSVNKAGVLTIEAKVPVPEVKGLAKMLLVFREVGQAASGDTIPTKPIFFDVYPRPKRSEWSDLIAAAEKQDGFSLCVFGESPRIREFLDVHSIDFRDLGKNFPNRFPADGLAVGEVTEDDMERYRPHSESGRKIFFLVGDRTQPKPLPGIYEISTPTGILSKVTLPLLSELQSNPKVQTAFLDLLIRNLNPETP